MPKSNATSSTMVSTLASSSHCCLLTLIKEDFMDKNDLKKLLAGLSIAGLVAGASLTGFGCATA
ncbi:MAG: selenobiotic family radical SAM modification target peptide [Desulfobacula sp.]|nr:selenobiotic family radical SAM modification target peptide [Desulfobacula sp.]